MTATLISGTEIARQIREEIKQEVIQLKAKHNLIPGLVTVLLGTDPGSLSYLYNRKGKNRQSLAGRNTLFSFMVGDLITNKDCIRNNGCYTIV